MLVELFDKPKLQR